MNNLEKCLGKVVLKSSATDRKKIYNTVQTCYIIFSNLFNQFYMIFFLPT